MLLNLLRGKTLEDLVDVKRETEANLQQAESIIRDLHSGSHELVVDALKQIIGKPEIHSVLPGLQKLEFEARPHHVNTALARVALQADVPVWLHGEAGSGKSTTGEVAAATLGLDVRSISLGPTTSKADLLGYRDATGEYHDTGFRRMYEDGGLFMFDEIDNAHPSILTILNSAVANSIGEFPDARVRRAENTRFIATANTIGRGATAHYVGRAPIDAATIDRFAFVPMDIDPALEESLILGNGYHSSDVDISAGGVPDRREWLAVVRANREAAAELGIRTIISQRASLYGVRLAEHGVGQDWLKDMLIYKGMNESDREKLDTKARSLVDSIRKQLQPPKAELVATEMVAADSKIVPENAPMLTREPHLDIDRRIARALGDLYTHNSFMYEQDAKFIVSLAWRVEKQYGRSIFDVELSSELRQLRDFEELPDVDSVMDAMALSPAPFESLYSTEDNKGADFAHYFSQYMKYVRDRNPEAWPAKNDTYIGSDVRFPKEAKEFVDRFGFEPGPTSLAWWLLNKDNLGTTSDSKPDLRENNETTVPIFEGLPDSLLLPTNFGMYVRVRKQDFLDGRRPNQEDSRFITALAWNIEQQHGRSVFGDASWHALTEDVYRRQIKDVEDILSSTKFKSEVAPNLDSPERLQRSPYSRILTLCLGSVNTTRIFDTPTPTWDDVEKYIDDFEESEGFSPGPTSLAWWMMRQYGLDDAARDD